MTTAPSLLAASKGGSEIPSSRYRVHALLPLLEARGWRTQTLTPSMIGRSGRLRAIARDARRAGRRWDVVLLQRPGRRREEGALLRLAARGAVVAVDLDDPVDETGAMAWALSRADMLFVASRALEAKYAGRGLRIGYVPTSVDARLYAGSPPGGGGRVVGFVGDVSSYREPLIRMLHGVARAASDWQVRIAGTRGNKKLEGALARALGERTLVTVPDLRWEDEAAVAEEIRRYDVGLAPLRDPLGGSYKTIQYLAAGVVPIAEAGGEAEHHARAALDADAPVIQPDDVEALAAALDRLADRERRARLGARAQRTVQACYSREAVAARVDMLLRPLLPPRPA